MRDGIDSEHSGHQFGIGDLVRLRVAPDRTGSVVEVLPPLGDMPRYRVFHGASSVLVYLEDQLEAVDMATVEGALADALSLGGWTPDFAAHLVAARLDHPATDDLYSLRAARIRFVPFQFKPVLRFLRADRPRLLIADEVGVGKTIEAGLILKELRSRQSVDPVLVLCPKALTIKWRAELRRFDEDFRILDSAALRYCIDETELDGVWPEHYAKAILPLELARIETHLLGTAERRTRPGLLTVDPPPRFGLVIVDEAHHVRTPGTNSNELARFLGDAAEAMVLLSATPLQTSSNDLFQLLHVLRPDQFRSIDVFREMIEPNEHLATAMRLVRFPDADPTWARTAAEHLRAAADTTWGRRALAGEPRLQQALAALSAAPLDDEHRVRVLRDLEELHTFASVMNRTRRRDIGAFTIREPITESLPFTPPQQALYDELIGFQRRVAELRHGPQVARLMTDTLERQAASCLPALVPAIDALIARGFASLTDDPEAELTEPAPISDPELEDMARQLRHLAESLPPGDPKADRAVAVAKEAMTADRPGKTLLFSFFLHTLAYLEQQLADAGLRVATITGATADLDREELRERFRLPREHRDAIDVLLSSEVGCEGLDYEFCDQLINYDLPWNPMRVEQRIGRIDRFGQQSEKVLIVNFVTPGTVEERVFFRAYERMGVFHRTIGDTEEVLGRLASELGETARDIALTPEQQAERAQQLVDNELRHTEEQRRLEEQSGDLLGLDQLFSQEVDDAMAAHRFVGPSDLRLLVEAFLASLEAPVHLRAVDATHDDLRARPEAKRALRAALRGVGGRLDTAFATWFDDEAADAMRLTFDSETALDERSLPFLTPVHPLVRAAVRALAPSGPSLGLLTLEDDSLPPGRYLFACERWERCGARPDVRLITIAIDLDQGNEVPELSTRLLGLIPRATPIEDARPELAELVAPAAAAIDAALLKRRTADLAELRDENDTLVDRRAASLEAHHGARLTAIDERLAEATDPRIRRMKEAERARATAEYLDQTERLDALRRVDVITERVATGILEVRHAH